ncbi:MAG: hypothetical protein ACRD2P_03640 [Terriglobia bacterium]
MIHYKAVIVRLSDGADILYVEANNDGRFGPKERISFRLPKKDVPNFKSRATFAPICTAHRASFRKSSNPSHGRIGVAGFPGHRLQRRAAAPVRREGTIYPVGLLGDMVPSMYGRSPHTEEGIYGVS